MGSLIDELQRLETAARAQAEELRGQIAHLAEQLAGVEARLARLVTAPGLPGSGGGGRGCRAAAAGEAEAAGRPGWLRPIGG